MVAVTIITLLIVATMLFLVNNHPFIKGWPATYRFLVVILPGIFGGIQCAYVCAYMCMCACVCVH